jgi:hypothetical protein
VSWLAYERELAPVLELVRLKPGLTVAAMGKLIRRLPAADRHDPAVPSPACLKWKLRYLEQAGYVTCRERRWYVMAVRR